MRLAMYDAELALRVRRTVDELAEEFRGVFGPQTIQRCADESVARLRDARVADYVPLFVYKYTRERLLARGQANRSIPKDRPEVLFVCVHNAGRSQMAAALIANASQGGVNVRSAGSAPANEIDPATVEAMAELGIDLSEQFPKPLADEFVEAADVVVTMGCGDACPVYPGKLYRDWEVDDPAGQPLPIVRRIRDDIRRRVEALLRELGVAEGVR